MKKMIAVLLTALVLLSLTACGNSTKPEISGEQTPTEAATSMTSDDQGASSSGKADTQTAAEPTDSASSEQTGGDQAVDETQGSGKTLVVVFSATGTTKGVAEKIAALTGAELYEIKAAQEYTEADLNWHDDASRTTVEQNDSSVRPEIGSDPISLEGYETVYIGYPIWWGEEPRIMDTFVESHDFDGMTVIPFCTSSSSGIGRSGQNLADNAGKGNWLEGRRFSGGVSEADLQSWIDSLQG